MIRRIIRGALVFVAILAAYQAYALVTVPWLEPALVVKDSGPLTPYEQRLARQAPTRYQLLLRNYFPQGHWTQRQPPIVVASSDEQAMLVMDDYERVVPTPGGKSLTGGQADAPQATQVKISRFALLVFPTPPREGITPPQDAIILEAPQGASLHFDDFRPERGHIGQITRGLFPGPITIRSSMNDPGPEDDLLVETADLEMNTRLLYTTRPVRFRLGQNMGGGHELEIRFLAEEHARPRDAGFKIAGIESLEVRRKVRLRLQLETGGLLPGNRKPSESSSRAPRGNSIPNRPGAEAAPAPQSGEVSRSHAERGNEKPPVEITCNGPFHFDFVHYIASVDRDVVLRQINPNGPSDQVTCNQLDVHFAPKPRSDGQVEPVIVDPARRQQRDLSRLEPAMIVAAGHPVVITSPARQAEARGDRVQIDLRASRLAVNSSREAMLVSGQNVIRAPAIEYQHPAANDPTTIGRFKASGPGVLYFVPDITKPQQVLQATWRRLVELGRDNGQPSLALEGRPQLAMANMGALAADRIVVQLRELQGSAAAGIGLPISGGGAAQSKLQVMPDRLTATGRVEFQSPQLTGRTQELVTTFRIQPAAPTTTPTPSVPAARGVANQLNVTPSPNQSSSQQPYHLDADRIRIGVLLRDNSAVPSSVVCERNVVLREVPVARTTEQPLEIRGDRLTIDQLDVGAAHIVLTGASPINPRPVPVRDRERVDETPASQPAQLIGRGVTVLADRVELDQRDNRLWSKGPGKATLLVTRDLNGDTSATPIPMQIEWQDGLVFDGRTVVFQRNVIVTGTDDTLRCDELTARLSNTVTFGQSIDGRSIELAEVECRGNVSIDHRSRDDAGITSHERLQMARLSLNQQTGEISGDGPGVLRSTRFGNSVTPFAAPPLGASPAAMVSPPPGFSGNKLNFLRIDFQQGIAGNMHLRELSFQGRVRTVYGPVDSWEQELDTQRPEALPPESVRLSCDELRVNENPIAARTTPKPAGSSSTQRGPVQVQALGNVRLDGHSPEHGAFAAQAARASYDESKDTFILEGDMRTPATVRYAGQQGTPPAVRRIRYVRATGEWEIDDLLYLEFTSQDLENASRENPTTR
jgi:hypothetical protein